MASRIFISYSHDSSEHRDRVLGLANRLRGDGVDVDQVFQLLLDGGHRPTGEPMECQDAVRRVLRHLAAAMTLHNLDAEPVTVLEARLYKKEVDDLRKPLERVPRWRRSMRPFLDDLAERTGILGPHDGPEADWRFWHRTFREAFTAESLEQTLLAEGETALLEHATQIAGDESRWAEPYALLAGRVKDPDTLVRALVNANKTLGLRAVATAQGLEDKTLADILELSDEWEERREVYERIPELVADPQRALALLDRLRQRTRNGNDLFFLEQTVVSVGEKSPDYRRLSDQVRARLYDHIPKPSEDLFHWIDTPHNGRVELWREIPAGRFLMGSPKNEKGRYGDEGPRHEVAVESPFRLAVVPVTNAQYAAFDPTHQSEQQGKHHPVDTVTWYEAVSFCQWLSGSIAWARGARLPTEEEWEYACRAGTETRYWSGNEESDLAKVGWYDQNSDRRTHRVGEKPANAWDLYDIHGNVWEWTLTEWTDDYSGREKGFTVDPSAVDAADLAAASPGADRVFRGGSFWDGARMARSACRDGGDPGAGFWNQGFRVLLPCAPEILDL